MTQKKTRDSNMELLRLMAMLLVMMVHASYRALPKPTPDSITDDPVSSFLQISTESFTIMAVNVFVMLSGWYGIRLRWKRLGELLFQVFFFGVLCLVLFSYLQTLVLPYTVPASKPPVTTLFMLGENDYWFVKTYIALYLCSPLLNAFVEKATRQQMALALTSLFIFQWVFGWVFEATSWLRAGYSLPSFACLYLLARYISIHRPRFAQQSRWTDLAVYIGTCTFVTIAYFFLKRHFNFGGVLLYYNSPTTIVSATAFLLFFSKLRLKSRVINWLAVSALAVYLTHSSSYLAKYYDHTIVYWHDTLSRPSFLLHATFFIAIVFFGSILIDKVRLFVWSRLMTFTAYKDHRSPNNEGDKDDEQ